MFGTFEVTVRENDNGTVSLFIGTDYVQDYITDNAYRLATELQNEMPNVDVYVYDLAMQLDNQKFIDNL